MLGNSTFHMQFKRNLCKYYIDQYSSLRTESQNRHVKLLNHSLNKGILLLSWGFVNLQVLDMTVGEGVRLSPSVFTHCRQLTVFPSQHDNDFSLKIFMKKFTMLSELPRL